MSYTKGPWEMRATLRGDFEIHTSSAEPRMGYMGWAGLATFYGSGDNRRVARANATLAAAAPELLEALRGLHDDIAEYQRLNNLGGYDNHWMRLARAAIEKATKP